MKKIKELIINNWLNVYTIYLITVITDSSTFFMRYSFIDDISKYIRYITYVYFGIRIILMRKEYIKLLKSRSDLLTKLLYLCLTLISIFLLVNFAMTKNRRMLSIIIILLSAINVDYKDIFKRTMIVQLVCTALIVLSSVIGLSYNYKVGRQTSSRYSLGFTYPTDLSQIIMFGTLLYFYSYKDKVRMFDILFLEIIVVLTYFIADTKADFFISQIIIIIMIMFKAFNKFKVEKAKDTVKAIYSFIFTTIYPLIPIYSLLVTLIFKNHSKLIKLNNILSNRLSQTYFNLITHKLSPFGSNISFYGLGIREKLEGIKLSKLYVDNEYIQMAFKEGYLVAIMFVLILSLILIMLYKLKKHDEIIVLSIFLVFGLINARIITLMYCPILFIIIPIIKEYNESYIRKKVV